MSTIDQLSGANAKTLTELEALQREKETGQRKTAQLARENLRYRQETKDLSLQVHFYSIAWFNRHSNSFFAYVHHYPSYFRFSILSRKWRKLAVGKSSRRRKRPLWVRLRPMVPAATRRPRRQSSPVASSSSKLSRSCNSGIGSCLLSFENSASRRNLRNRSAWILR